MGKGALGALAAYWPEDTARYAHIPLKRIGDLTIHAQAAAAGDHLALVGAGSRLTYGELSESVKRVAAALRGRATKGSRIAIALVDPLELVTVLFAAFENEMLAWASAGPAEPELLAAFTPDLVVGVAGASTAPAVGFAALAAEGGDSKTEKPDYKKPLLAFAKPDRSGEVVHNHKTLAATAISMGSFFMLDGEAKVLLVEPPVDWLSIAALLGTFHRGGCVWIGAEGEAAPERVDYLVGRWPAFAERYLDAPPRIPRLPIGAGALVGVEGAFSLSQRRRLSRRLGAPVLTILGRSDLGPTIASHPSWFLDDAVGIPLPNVDTRPLNPADGTPLSIGWDSVESAEVGIKSALAPAGGEMVAEGWLRTGLSSEIDPTGLYFLRG